MNNLEFHYFFIDENLSSLDPEDLGPGPRIVKVKIGANFPVPTNSDGPYLSIRNLRKVSSRFKYYRSKNNKRAQKICEDRWISEMHDQGIVSPLGKGYPEEFMRSINHITVGTVKKGIVTGVHFVDLEKVRILDVIRENELGALEAVFEYYDSKTKQWYRKKSTSTFFPKSWSLSRLFHECAYAFFDHRKELVEGTKNIYKSRTKSGVDVRIVMTGDKVKTMYPTL